MIDIEVTVHDKFSIEFKVGFVVRRRLRRNDFAVNTWLFVPNSLDINPQTYDKQLFYRDIKSNVRLITPVFKLAALTGVPLHNLKRAIAGDDVREMEYHIKMYCAIFKSAQREAAPESYIAGVRAATEEYRALREKIPEPLREYYAFGDEYLSNIVTLKAFAVGEKTGLNDALRQLIADEDEYKQRMGYLRVDAADPHMNRELVFRQSVLKKYIESDLFLVANRKKDGRIAEQLLYAIAAGVSMVFATAVAFWGQVRFGAVATPFFFALVISYMLKDRIKEVLRYFFAHSLSRRYFDTKTHIGIKEVEIGWIKEAVDFVPEERVPAKIIEMRNRSSLVRAENRTMDEKILLYRKLVHIDREVMDGNSEYKMAGVNDIMRLHFTHLVEKADDPEMPVPMLTEQGVSLVEGMKCYFANIVLQMLYDGQLKYRRYRVTFTRDGIVGVEEFIA